MPTAGSEGADSGDVVRVPVAGRSLRDIEREVIVDVLRRNRGHRQKTARQLDIGLRTLGLKIKQWKAESLVEPDL